jgi:Ca2+-binding RTX toxin-like protein
VDYVEGNGGADDLVGGSSTPSGSAVPGTGVAASSGQPDTADVLWGGPADDTAIGDNGSVLRGAGTTPNKVFDRLGSAASATRVQQRQVLLYDLGNGQTSPPATLFGGDWVSGGSEVDVLWGQDGDDAVSGGPGADYAEGNGGDDAMRGDALLTDPVTNAGFAVPAQPVAAWRPHPTTDAALLEGSGANGQDDLIGGSGRQRFRDDVNGGANDRVEGNGADDMALGDNGTLLRVVSGANGSAVEAVDAARYSEDAGPPARRLPVPSRRPGRNRVQRHDPLLHRFGRPGHAVHLRAVMGVRRRRRLGRRRRRPRLGPGRRGHHPRRQWERRPVRRARRRLTPA